MFKYLMSKHVFWVDPGLTSGSNEIKLKLQSLGLKLAAIREVDDVVTQKLQNQPVL